MTKTTTTHDGKDKGPVQYHDVRELVIALMDHPMSPKEMMQLQNKYETHHKWHHGNFQNLIQYLGGFEPIYEHSVRRYKILTQKDIESYREELRIKNGKQRNDLAKNATKYN